MIPRFAEPERLNQTRDNDDWHSTFGRIPESEERGERLVRFHCRNHDSKDNCKSTKPSRDRQHVYHVCRNANLGSLWDRECPPYDRVTQ